MLWMVLATLLLAYLIIGEFVAIVSATESRVTRKLRSVYRVRYGRLTEESAIGNYLSDEIYRAERSERLAFLWPYLIVLTYRERKQVG